MVTNDRDSIPEYGAMHAQVCVGIRALSVWHAVWGGGHSGMPTEQRCGVRLRACRPLSSMVSIGSVSYLLGRVSIFANLRSLAQYDACDLTSNHQGEKGRASGEAFSMSKYVKTIASLGVPTIVFQAQKNGLGDVWNGQILLPSLVMK